MTPAPDAEATVLLVCSSGGHLDQLLLLEPWLSQFDVAIATFAKPDALARLEGRRFYPLAWPTNRRIWNNLRNAARAWRILGIERPDLIISSGAAPAVPFFWLSKLRGQVPTVFVECFDRQGEPTLTTRLIKPVATTFVCQGPTQLAGYPRRVELGASR
jgi:UDP-N-acetylglucosamine:LPS N-acetylglucosamine transferase